jgi:YggT family protein
MIGGIIYAIGGFIEALIGLRFIFRLLGANPVNVFVNWIYDWSTPFVSPFAGIFGQNATVAGPGVVTTSVFDWTALIAFIVIGILLALIGGIFYRTHHHIAV